MAGVQTIAVERGEADMRVDRWFKAHFPDVKHGALEKLLRTGQVRVDGKRVKANARLVSGQEVRIPPLSDEAAAGRPALVVPGSKDARMLRDMTLHEDDAVLVLNKPRGLAVQGGSGVRVHVDGLLEALRDRKGQKPRLVHRLDRDTSGALVVAKTRGAASALAKSFRSRRTRKIYWALVRGVPKPRQGRISTYIARDPADSERMHVAQHGDRGADHAESLYNVVDQAGSLVSWLSMSPLTGRTHQLRVHAECICHPIVGDPKYFDVLNWELPGGIQNKLHLLARRIVIPHPNGGVVDVTAPLPDHMRLSWNLMGFDPDRYDKEDEECDDDD